MLEVIESAVDKVFEFSAQKVRKFTESVEVIINLTPDKQEIALRGSYIMPNKLGKEKKVGVFTEDTEKAKTYAAAGANNTDFLEMIEKISKKKIECDVYLAHSSMMPKLKKVAGILGSRGLMPNGKVGTLVDDPMSVLQNMRFNAVFYKSTSNVVQTMVGTVGVDKKQIVENINAFTQYILDQVKNGAQSIYIKSTMGKPIKIK